jgi:ABC-type antimicrobial peptide transport system permease subunit
LGAQGMRSAHLRALLFGETAVVGMSGLGAGTIVGCAVAFLLVHILRPLFILDPVLLITPEPLAIVSVVAAAATVASALAGAAILQRVRPGEVLREA